MPDHIPLLLSDYNTIQIHPLTQGLKCNVTKILLYSPGLLQIPDRYRRIFYFIIFRYRTLFPYTAMITPPSLAYRLLMPLVSRIMMSLKVVFSSSSFLAISARS